MAAFPLPKLSLRVSTPDVARLVGYYTDVLGFEQNPHVSLEKHGMAVVQLGATELAFSPGEAGPPGPIQISLLVDELGAWLAKVPEADRSAPRKEPWGVHAFELRDPDGNRLYIASRKYRRPKPVRSHPVRLSVRAEDLQAGGLLLSVDRLEALRLGGYVAGAAVRLTAGDHTEDTQLVGKVGDLLLPAAALLSGAAVAVGDDLLLARDPSAPTPTWSVSRVRPSERDDAALQAANERVVQRALDIILAASGPVPLGDLARVLYMNPEDDAAPHDELGVVVDADGRLERTPNQGVIPGPDAAEGARAEAVATWKRERLAGSMDALRGVDASTLRDALGILAPALSGEAASGIEALHRMANDQARDPNEALTQRLLAALTQATVPEDDGDGL